ncbi:MAG: cation transporter [Phycisphaeraceae bacterium]|nr:cation transporter [Phycisphaeraceae bacterium]
MIPQRCIDCGKKVQWIILGINLSLFFVKLSFAIISHSKALLTDSFQSLANVVITIVVICSMRLADRGADERFPYGYGKIEFLASGVVNMMLMLGAIAFIIFTFHEMVMVGPEKPPELIAIAAAMISIIGNMLAYHYGRCAGEKLGSTVILANAEISRADVGTSVAVIVAVVGCQLGFSSLDHIVAIAIGAMIIKVAWDGAQKAVNGLMDASLHNEEVNILNLVEDVPGVSRVDNIKVRMAGRELLVDMDVFVPGDVQLNAGLETSTRIRDLLHKKIKSVSDVSVQLLPIED